MNMKKTFPLTLALSILLTVILISSLTFGTTFAWFVKTLDPPPNAPETAIGQMGEVSLGLTNGENGNILTNAGTIPIIVRIRVILEFTADDGSMPFINDDEYFDIIKAACDNSNLADKWTVLRDKNPNGGVFLVYTENSDPELDLGIYGVLKPYAGIEVPALAIEISDSNSDERGYSCAAVYYIAEALQATPNAYEDAFWSAAAEGGDEN